MPQEYIIGCSGFHYKDWKRSFYPERIPQKKWLEYYAQHFKTVEINNSFYGMPKEETVSSWYKRVPPDFSFTLKGNRFITHIKKIKDVEEPLYRFYHLADLLADKLGCILWQLPPYLQNDPGLLKSFCHSLNTNYKNVMEFRHSSWYNSESYKILEDNNVGYCIISAPGFTEDLISTADFAYVRFHGKTDWYRYKYSKEEMEKWKVNIQSLNAKEVFIYFNNDYNANAVINARELMWLLLKVESRNEQGRLF